MSINLKLPGLSASELAALCGPDNATLKRIESELDVSFHGKPGNWEIKGEKGEKAAGIVRKLSGMARSNTLTPTDVEGVMADQRFEEKDFSQGVKLAAGRRLVEGKTANQRKYLQQIQDNTLVISVGPAGSGKTYLAVASAVVALTSHQVERIILTRPAVEAGEKLGFLPGDMQQKVDPYLRPLFDALADMLGMEQMNAMLESGRIEIAPLAYMRGRTLNDAFIILDEAQNTTRAQMKMFLTRLGFGSKMVVTGDSTQVDLPQHHHSGLLHALQVLENINDIGISRLTGKDVVRHRLVERIVDAYEQNND